MRHHNHVASLNQNIAGPRQLRLPAAVLQHSAPLLLGRRLMRGAHAAVVPLPLLRLALRVLLPLLLLAAGLL